MLDFRGKSPRKRGVFPSFFAHFWAKMGCVDNLSVTFSGLNSDARMLRNCKRNLLMLMGINLGV